MIFGLRLRLLLCAFGWHVWELTRIHSRAAIGTARECPHCFAYQERGAVGASWRRVR